jgi:hypothetical protein
VEHLIPVSVDPLGECEYANLLYACSTCNAFKSDVLGFPDPCSVAFGDCLRINSQGEVEALNKDGEKLVAVLRLNNPQNLSFRSRLMQVLEVLRSSHLELYEEYMGFPKDLPDLRRKRVPSNGKPAAEANCYFALRERGKLPKTY